ncbi:MAG: TIGR02921 family PEP-CTERM protein [Chloroflexi bacterium]|nr:TIGR02921 family PEP-CTERM protein [Chloroflexota bacterium]
MKNQMLSFVRQIAQPSLWAYGLFWSWNIIFVAFMLLGFAPRLLPELLTAVSTGTIPAIFLIFAIVLTAIPVAAVILGLTLLRRSPAHLVALLYAVEGPLMFMLAIRFFLIREATAIIVLAMTVASLGLLTLLWQLLDRRIDARGAGLTILRAVGLTLFLLVVLYGSVWLAFYTVPLTAQIVNALGEMARGLWNVILAFRFPDLSRIQWGFVPFTVLGVVLMAYTATLFIGAPIAVPVIALWAWRKGARVFSARYGVLRALALVAVVVIVFAALLVWSNQQPQRAAFVLLKTPPTSPAEAQALRNQEGALRDGLLNAYLAPFRYLSSVGEVQGLAELYRWTWRLSPDQVAGVTQLHDVVARPLLYEPVNAPKPDDRDGRAFREEPVEAARLYKTYFDQTILDGERETIVNAVRSTWQFSQAEAAWQAVDDRRVHLARQEVMIKENGDWAEVELYEVYQNQTDQMQEVVYYFSLPESAVVTGLWLGTSADRAARLVYHVSPRGAAQALYRNEIRRWQDPALVEQIGPRQYRLRAFPVDGRRWQQDPLTGRATVGAGPPLHLWLTYRVLARDNAWMLPRLAEKRNVFWDAATVRVVNGKTTQASAHDWLPASIVATTTIKPVAHRVEFPNGQTIVARPVSASELPKLTGNLRLAVVLDRSRSMSKFAAEVKTTLARFSQIAGATTDVYLTSSLYRGEAPTRVALAQLNLDNIQYLGGQNAGELLAQFDQLRADQKYDAILVVTDGSGYELGASSVKVPIPDAPVWMIHLGGNLPLGYDDATLAAIQASGGGVTGNIEDALNRLAVARHPRVLASTGALADATPEWVDGYAWFTYSTQVAGTSGGAVAPDAISDDFGAFAARALILGETQCQRKMLGQLSTLDQLHAIAVKHSVVTPYSSMIVVVNAQQEQRLKQLEASGDRFEREVEEVGNTAPANAFAVTGVPEPEEWLLLALAAAVLGGYLRLSRRATRSTRVG